MKKEGLIGIIVLVIIVAIALVLYLSNSTDNNKPDDNTNDPDYGLNVSFYELNGDHDDARTFSIKNVPDGFGNEDGAWATNQLSPSYSFGLVFHNIDVPKNATIEQAYIELYSIGVPGIDNANCNIYCDYVDNAENFTSKGVLNVTGRNYTQNFSLWNETLTYGEWVKTPMIIAPIKEVMSRANWTDGNSIAFLFVSNGLKGYSTTFQNYESGYPAKLYIKWI